MKIKSIKQEPRIIRHLGSRLCGADGEGRVSGSGARGDCQGDHFERFQLPCVQGLTETGPICQVALKAPLRENLPDGSCPRGLELCAARCPWKVVCGSHSQSGTVMHRTRGPRMKDTASPGPHRSKCVVRPPPLGGWARLVLPAPFSLQVRPRPWRALGSEFSPACSV